MARTGNKRKVDDREDGIPIRTTPRKRKQIEYAEADVDAETERVNGSVVTVNHITPTKSKAKRKVASKKPDAVDEPTVKEEVEVAVAAVNGSEAVARERHTINLKSSKSPKKGKGKRQNAPGTQAFEEKLEEVDEKVVEKPESTKSPKRNKKKKGQATDTQALNDELEEAEEGVAEKPRRKRKTKEEKEAEAMPLAARTAGLKMFVGAHTSMAKGIENSITNCVHIGGNAFACFLKSQRKWDTPALKDENRDAFKQHLITHKYDGSKHIVPHGSYLVNLASADKEMAKKSYDAFFDDLQRCEALGIKHYNFHPGAAGQAPMAEAIGRIASNLNRALANTTTVVPLLENMATRGSIIGGRFQDLRDIIALIKPEYKSRIGVCIDTCHAFASGYDLRTPEAFKKTLLELDDVVGIEYVKALHLNDSKAPYASNRDLHQNIGLGFLGLRAFHNVMNEPRFHDLPLILETPCEKPDPDDSTGKKVLEDRAIWATEIKLLESLTGMDPDSSEFRKLEKELSDRGKIERDKLQKQFDEKQAKEAKKREKGQKSLKDMFGGQETKKAKIGCDSAFAVLTDIIFGNFAILAWTASNRSNTLSSESLGAARNANSLASRANEMGSSANAPALRANAMATSASVIATEASPAQAYTQITASVQAATANKIALLAYCSNIAKMSTTAYALCNSAQSAAMSTIPHEICLVFPQYCPQTSGAPVSQVSNGQPQAPTSSSSAAPTGHNSTSSGSPSSSQDHGLTTGGKAGIGVGAATIVLCLISVLWFSLWRSYQYREKKAKAFARSQFRSSESSMRHVKGIGSGPGVHVQMREAGVQSREAFDQWRVGPLIS